MISAMLLAAFLPGSLIDSGRGGVCLPGRVEMKDTGLTDLNHGHGLMNPSGSLSTFSAVYIDISNVEFNCEANGFVADRCKCAPDWNWNDKFAVRPNDAMVSLWVFNWWPNELWASPHVVDFDSNARESNFSWCSPGVRNDDSCLCGKWTTTNNIAFAGDANGFHAHIGPDLILTNLSGVFGHFLGVIDHFLSGKQSSPYIVNTNSSNSGHKGRYYQHPERPERHFRLGYKVILSALALVCGFYYATYAFRLGSSVTPETGVSYFLFGLLGIGTGIAGLIGYGFAILPP